MNKKILKNTIIFLRNILNKIFINNNLYLRELTINDKDDIFNYSSDVEFCKYLDFNVPKNSDDILPFLRQITNDNNSGTRIYWGIEYKNKIIGTIGLLNINNIKMKAELGFGIGKKYWGKGIINRCIENVLNYSFIQKKFKIIKIGTNINNIRANNFILKTGFIKDKETKIHTYYNMTKDRYLSKINMDK
jgi:[ribosomal protein S5]-alanine N-acetyltransferase